MDDPTRYKDLGLLNTREMFKKAMEGGYALPAYNFNNMEQLQAIVIGCVESKSPVILQVSGSARKYLGPARDELIKMVKHKNINILGSAHQA
jgi:fructose-bisphosphate aldolase, class II